MLNLEDIGLSKGEVAETRDGYLIQILGKDRSIFVHQVEDLHEVIYRNPSLMDKVDTCSHSKLGFCLKVKDPELLTCLLIGLEK